jgi:acyl-CoA dehydrogenase
MREPSPRSHDLGERLLAFFDRHIYPNEELFHEQVARNRWQVPAIVEQLKVEARAEGLWNLFLPDASNAAWSNFDYAPPK